ncbi:hypothetical protein V6N13_041512 [Hibiscus sabdariffa]|uniref:Uncharacterized protein n=2 Tax=Hibiscus sabdariffa TaxID=183260 RepID=A0ABR2RBV0_9ROSI
MGTSASLVTNAEKETLQEVGNNLFLAAPLQPEEKDVPPLFVSAKLSDVASSSNSVSVLQAFAPAIEAKKGGPSNESNGEKTLPPEKRAAVHFKFRAGKKILGEPLDLCLQKKGSLLSIALPLAWILLKHIVENLNLNRV